MKPSSASDERSQKMSTYKDVLENIPRKDNTQSIPANIRHGLFLPLNQSELGPSVLALGWTSKSSNCAYV